MGIPKLNGHLAMDQYLLIPFLVGWTSIYQLFWCSPGVPGFWPTAISGSDLLEVPTIYKAYVYIRPKFQGISHWKTATKSILHLPWAMDFLRVVGGSSWWQTGTGGVMTQRNVGWPHVYQEFLPAGWSGWSKYRPQQTSRTRKYLLRCWI